MEDGTLLGGNMEGTLLGGNMEGTLLGGNMEEVGHLISVR
jgi:hypothetical protein